MIPFSRPTTGIEEANAAAAVIESGWLTVGPKTKEFEEKFAEYVGGRYAVFLDSGTSALELACEYLRYKFPTWNISVPSFTFAATVEAPLHARFPIQFVDINKNDLSSESSIVVHYGGEYAPYARDAVIVDSAHRIEKGDVQSNPSAIWCYSFHASKNMTTGKGGMFVTDEKEAYEWVLLAREHGISVDTEKRYKKAYRSYDIDFIGWNKKSGDLNAAIGLEQLKKLPENNRKRDEVVLRYNEAFDRNWNGNHLYPVFVTNPHLFIDHLFEHGISTAIHYKPLHQMKAYQKYPRPSLPNTDWVANHIVNIPLFPTLLDEEVEYIIKTVLATKMLISTEKK